MRTHTRAHTDTHTHRHARTHSHTHTHSHTLTSHTYTHKRRHTPHAHTHQHMVTRLRAPAHTNTNTRKHADTQTHAFARPRTHTHSPILTLTQIARFAQAMPGLGPVSIAAAVARVQAINGGAVYVAQGTLVFDGVAISSTRADVRPLGLAHGVSVGGGRPAADRGGVRRVAAAPCTCTVGPSRSKGAARSRPPQRCAPPKRTRPHACVGSRKLRSTGARAHMRTNTHSGTHARACTHRHVQAPKYTRVRIGANIQTR